MKQYIRLYWPEGILVIFTIFFAFRELGTFPSAWLDDSLFMLVAKNLAEGRGYTLPVLTEQWWYSYILAVGPTVIVPAALFIKLFGFSVAVARIPFAIFICAIVWMMYHYTLRIADKTTGRMSAALLVSLSAFVNTGKPVLGEVPAFFFLLVGMYFLFSARTYLRYAIVGIFFGLAVISKLTYGMLFPVLGIVGIMLLIRREWTEFKKWFLLGIVAFCSFGIWHIFEMLPVPGSFLEIMQFGLAGGGADVIPVLQAQPELLLRFPYLYFGALFIVFCIGLWQIRARIGNATTIFILGFVLFFIAYFLNGPGWYRHILPAHLLMIPFIFIGAERLLTRNIAMLIMLFFILSQGLWQLDHRGSNRIYEAESAVEILLEQYGDIAMVIQQPEIYIRLPYVENRFFISEEMNTREFVIFDGLPLKQEEYCLPLVRKIGSEDRPSFAGRIHELYGRYVLIDPPKECVSHFFPVSK